MEFSAEDKDVLKAAVGQLWAKGCHTPQESNVAGAFTNLVQRILMPPPPKPQEPPK